MSFFQQMADYWKRKIPFLFAIDFEGKQPFILLLDKVDDSSILFAVKGFSNSLNRKIHQKQISFEANPVAYEKYFHGFEKVAGHINRGNSYLLNLTPNGASVPLVPDK